MTLRTVCAAALAAVLLGDAPALAQDVRYEHRVAVSTTSLDTELDVEASLERNVNALAGAGYEVTAIVGGHGPVLDRLLERKPYAAGLVDHGGHVFVVMARQAGREARGRQYRLLHTRRHIGVDPIVASLGENGYRLVATAVEGDYFHAAFELADGPRYDYRVYANKGRSSWMSELEKDPVALSRLARVAPMGLDHALVELQPAPAAPGALEWFTVKAHAFASSDAKLHARAAQGYRVQMVRVRETDVDVLMVKPAGTHPAAAYDLEDAPWGMPCTRGAIAGADIFTDGDTYCVVERTDTATTNRGFDLRIRVDGGRYLLDIPGCEARALAGSRRAAIRRLVVAAQLERALDSKTPAGFRVSRALTSASASGDARVTVFTTKSTDAPVSALSKTRPSEPALSADRDELLQGTGARLEDALTSALSSNASLASGLVWVEVTTGAGRTVRLAGCVNNSRDKATAERVLRGLLVRTALDQAPLANEIIVDPWR